MDKVSNKENKEVKTTKEGGKMNKVSNKLDKEVKLKIKINGAVKSFKIKYGGRTTKKKAIQLAKDKLGGVEVKTIKEVNKTSNKSLGGIKTIRSGIKKEIDLFDFSGVDIPDKVEYIEVEASEPKNKYLTGYDLEDLKNSVLRRIKDIIGSEFEVSLVYQSYTPSGRFNQEVGQIVERLSPEQLRDAIFSHKIRDRDIMKVKEWIRTNLTFEFEYKGVMFVINGYNREIVHEINNFDDNTFTEVVKYDMKRYPSFIEYYSCGINIPIELLTFKGFVSKLKSLNGVNDKERVLELCINTFNKVLKSSKNKYNKLKKDLSKNYPLLTQSRVDKSLELCLREVLNDYDNLRGPNGAYQFKMDAYHIKIEYKPFEGYTDRTFKLSEFLRHLDGINNLNLDIPSIKSRILEYFRKYMSMKISDDYEDLKTAYSGRLYFDKPFISCMTDKYVNGQFLSPEFFYEVNAKVFLATLRLPAMFEDMVVGRAIIWDNIEIHYSDEVYDLEKLNEDRDASEALEFIYLDRMYANVELREYMFEYLAPKGFAAYNDALEGYAGFEGVKIKDIKDMYFEAPNDIYVPYMDTFFNYREYDGYIHSNIGDVMFDSTEGVYLGSYGPMGIDEMYSEEYEYDLLTPDGISSIITPYEEIEYGAVYSIGEIEYLCVDLVNEGYRALVDLSECLIIGDDIFSNGYYYIDANDNEAISFNDLNDDEALYSICGRCGGIILKEYSEELKTIDLEGNLSSETIYLHEYCSDRGYYVDNVSEYKNRVNKGCLNKITAFGNPISSMLVVLASSDETGHTNAVVKVYLEDSDEYAVLIE